MVIWSNDLSGSINQNTPALLANNEFEMLKDVSQVQVGNVSHRLGTKLYLNSLGSSQIRGLGEYRKPTGVNYMHVIYNGGLYVNGVSTWTLQNAAVWDSTSDIDRANYIDRHYFASSKAGENIRYATETGSVQVANIFSVVASTDSTGNTLVVTTNSFSRFMIGFTIFNTTDSTSAVITGYTNATTVILNTSIGDTWDNDNLQIYLDSKYLAVNGAYMMAVGNSIFPRRSYFTNVDSDKISLATDFFITSLPPTGVASMGNGRTFIIFTRKGYMQVDPSDPVYTREVDGFGCVSHRSIKTLKGSVIYLGVDGFYQLSPNSSLPQEMSIKIKNDILGDALFNKINKGLYTVSAAGIKGNFYYCAVRSLTGSVKGKTLNSAVFVIDISQNNWKVETYTTNDLASVMAEFTGSNGETELMGGSFSNGTVYRMGVPGVYTDDNTTGVAQVINSSLTTKHYEYVTSSTGASKTALTRKLWFKYRSTSSISVSYSLDGSSKYVDVGDLPAWINSLWRYEYIDINVESRTISVDLGFTGDTTIYAIGFDADLQRGEGIKGL